ncbi:MAG: glycosyltransferase [Paludibacteraceae bacterium]|nr:glycosyltransferase [Paludibacteraceae bacterium]
MPKVSVILPVYGVAQYIAKCTDSLLNQTLDDLEIFFVDDHGPDNSMEIAQQRVAGHPRAAEFHFIKTPQNMGAGMARNYAIEQATGEYIAFVDSDDWIEPTMFEDLYNRAKQFDADICYGQGIQDFSDGRASNILKNPEMAEGPISHDSRAYFLSHYVSYFWTFLYKRSLVMDKNIRYPEERCADDSYFVACALFTAQTAAHVDKVYYHYLIRENSVVTTKNPTKYLKRLTVFSKLLTYAKQNGVYDEFKKEIDFLYVKKGYLLSSFNYIMNVDQPTTAELKRIQNEAETLVPNYRANAYVKGSKSTGCTDWLLRNLPSIAIRLVPIYVKRTGMLV